MPDSQDSRKVVDSTRPEAVTTYEKAQEGDASAEQVQVLDGLPLVKEATELKERANILFKQAKYNEAVKCYEEGLAVLDRCKNEPMLREELDAVRSLKVVLHCNLAQCLLDSQLYRRAIAAATECLKLDEENVKALYRRSKAFEALKEYQDALKDALALKKLGGGGLKASDVEKRCEKLLLTMQEENIAVNKVAKDNEDLFRMKERFEVIFDKYNLEDTDAAPRVAKWLVADKDLATTADKVSKKWGMTSKEAKHFAAWIQKGLDMKVIPTPETDPSG